MSVSGTVITDPFKVRKGNRWVVSAARRGTKYAAAGTRLPKARVVSGWRATADKFKPRVPLAPRVARSAGAGLRSLSTAYDVLSLPMDLRAAHLMDKQFRNAREQLGYNQKRYQSSVKNFANQVRSFDAREARRGRLAETRAVMRQHAMERRIQSRVQRGEIARDAKSLVTNRQLSMRDRGRLAGNISRNVGRQALRKFDQASLLQMHIKGAPIHAAGHIGRAVDRGANRSLRAGGRAVKAVGRKARNNSEIVRKAWITRKKNAGKGRGPRR